MRRLAAGVLAMGACCAVQAGAAQAAQVYWVFPEQQVHYEARVGEVNQPTIYDGGFAGLAQPVGAAISDRSAPMGPTDQPPGGLFDPVNCHYPTSRLALCGGVLDGVGYALSPMRQFQVSLGDRGDTLTIPRAGVPVAPALVDAGDGDDYVDVRNGTADQVDCGAGFDTAKLDAADTATNCEAVTRG